jgi:hypothetical protein
MLDILFHFFVSIPVDSVIMFHMIQKVTLNFHCVMCCRFFLAINLYVSNNDQLMLAATCGGVTSNWAV